MKDKESRTEQKHSGGLWNIMYDKGVLYFILSFLISSSIMLYSFFKIGIHPFGDRQMLVVDLWHQYYPFFRVLREKLLTGGSLLYSWQNGMGTNFIALIAYYAASPLNFISILFDDDHVRDALTYILIAKTGFSGAFFSCFLRYTYNRKDFSTVVFSVLFSLCSYTLGYYWNVMWFDTVALFPLVMLGVTALCREGKWKLYTVSLALSLIANYYVGYFTCIFTVIMFFCTAVIECRGIKDFFCKFGLILRSSALGAGLGGFILLPAYLGLQLTYSVENTFPREISWAEKWTDIFANLIGYQEPTHIEGLPNFACGMFAVTLFGVFLFSGGIKIREKITKVLMLGFIAVSCNMNVLNFIWHGFHTTNQLPYRYAFIFSFVFASAAYSGYCAIRDKGIKIYQIVLMLTGPLAVFGLNYLKDKQEFAFVGALKSSAIITAAYIIIFFAVKIFPVKSMKVKTVFLNLFIAAAVFSETVSAAVIGTGAVGSSAYSSYPASDEDVQILLSDISDKEYSQWYRTEMTKTYTLNDSALYGYTGVSQFSSSANVSVTRLFERLGLYASEAGNRYYYRISTPVVNSILGIKYIISKNGTLSSNRYDLELMNSSGKVNSYENKYPLSLGFMMNESILEMEDKEAVNPFEYQNNLMKKATGIDYAVFVAQPVALAEYDNINVSKSSFGNYTFVKEDSGKPASSKYSFKCKDGEHLYGYATGGNCSNLKVTVDGGVTDNTVSIEKYPIVFPMGNGAEGNTASAEITIADGKNSGSYKLMVYALREDAFEIAYDKLADEQLEVTEFSDTEIKGKIKAEKHGIMYLSIPYERGWKVYVDGERADTLPVLNSMLGVRLDAGEHDIRLKYVPEGFDVGTALSLGMLLCFIILCITDARKKKKTVPVQEESNEKSESNGGIQGDELSRVPDTEKCGDDSGDSGEASLEGAE